MPEEEYKITDRALRKMVKLESYISVMAEGHDKERLTRAYLELVEDLGLPPEYGESIRRGRL